MTNKIIGTIAVIALLIGGASYFRGPQVVEKYAAGQSAGEPNLGATNITTCNSINGVETCSYSANMQRPTTTPCSFKMQKDGFLIDAAFSVNNTVMPATLWTIATSSNSAASSTPLQLFNLASSTARAFYYNTGAATTTAGGVVTAGLVTNQGGLVVHANEFLTFSYSGALDGHLQAVYAPNGACSVTVRGI